MDKTEMVLFKLSVNNLKEIIQSLTRQPQGCNYLVTCMENFNATRELLNEAFENRDIMGKNHLSRYERGNKYSLS